MLVIAAIWHFVLGLQVVIEDYISDGALKIALLVLNKLGGAAFAVVLIIAILKLVA
jgi:succinate dehydrogenase / fumarate reductase membrane anchor subunit